MDTNDYYALLVPVFFLLMAACFMLSGAALVLLWPRSIPRAVEPPQPSR